jgi:molybdate transport system regulatory protein
MTLEAQLKLAVLEDNRFVFGDSEMRLLEAVSREGTLTEGAAALGLSYRVAWGKLRDLETAVGTRLVERTVGGRHGGSSRLTDAAVQLVEQYSRFREAVGTFALAEFEKCFGEASDCSKLIRGSRPEHAKLPDSPLGRVDPVSEVGVTGESR